jgi:hypothetical protein
MGSIQDQHLMLDEDGFRDHGTDAARTQEPGNRSEGMNKEHKEMAHRSIAARCADSGHYAEKWQFAMDIVRRPGYPRWRGKDRISW